MFFSKFKILITPQWFNLEFKHCIKLLIWIMLFHVVEGEKKKMLVISGIWLKMIVFVRFSTHMEDVWHLDANCLLHGQVKLNVLQHVMPQLQHLYQWLEEDFAPLQLCSKTNKIFEFLNENPELELSRYTKPLQNICFVRLLKQVRCTISICVIIDIHLASPQHKYVCLRCVMSVNHKHLGTG